MVKMFNFQENTSQQDLIFEIFRLRSFDGCPPDLSGGISDVMSLKVLFT